MPVLNGRLPDAMLAAIPGTSRRTAVDLLAQTVALREAFAAEFGKPLVITDAYRTFDEQVRLREDKGIWAAKPGTSNHGWGRAFDFGSGVNREGSPEYRWMKTNGLRFGFTHPRWAEDNNPTNGQQEPWHWEATPVPASQYAPAGSTPPAPSAPGAPEPPLPDEEDDMYTEDDRRRDQVTQNVMAERTAALLDAVGELVKSTRPRPPAVVLFYWSKDGSAYEADVTAGTVRLIDNPATLHDRITVLDRTGVPWQWWKGTPEASIVDNRDAFGRLV